MSLYQPLGTSCHFTNLWEHHVIVPTFGNIMSLYQPTSKGFKGKIFAELQIPQKSEMSRKLRNNKIIENFLPWHI
jgi:hypothetical protein